MRPLPLAASVFVVGLLVAARPAWADVAGTYNVKFEDVSTNCPSSLRYGSGPLTITVSRGTVKVDIPRTPVMTGAATNTGKISAKSKLGNTMLEGMTGVFSIAGKVTADGQLQLVMVGEYSANGKPLCTQSWNVSGPRAAKPK